MEDVSKPRRSDRLKKVALEFSVKKKVDKKKIGKPPISKKRSIRKVGGVKEVIEVTEVIEVIEILNEREEDLPIKKRLGKLREFSQFTQFTQIQKEKEEEEENTGVFFSLPPPLNKNKDEIIDWTTWISATSTKNYLLDDGFLDILVSKSSAVIKANPNYSKEIGKMITLSTKTTGFLPSLLNAGNVFESRIISLITKELGPKNVKNIGGNHNARSTQLYRDTIAALNNGIPCIFQGILRNYENNTYGVSDVLIRSDWINKLLDVNALSPEEIRVPGSKLSNLKNVRYHYVVVDIKYKTLPLRSDGIHLRNDANMKAYKSQLWIYNDALSKIQGYRPPYAFILGSKWKYTSMGETFEGKSCFERLGRIDYGNLDFSYIEKTRLAVNWLNDVRIHGDSWDLSKYPLPRDELYPNMCNRYDYPYHGIKKTFAESNGDLTLLWNIGPKQRRIANFNGVYRWEDPRCSPETLGVSGKVRSKVIRRILEANQSEGRTIYPKYISNNSSDWKNQEGRSVELFVDFETTCSVFNDMEDLPLNTGVGLIFLIGAGYVHPVTKEWVFNKFVVDKIDESEETRICQEFVSFTETLRKTFGIKKSLPLWHFSHAEPSFWKRAKGRFPMIFSKGNGGGNRGNRGNRGKGGMRNEKVKNNELQWTDLLKVFLSEPIGIKGVLNFGLKNIAKAFYKHGFISTTWDSESCTADGADVAVESYRANNECTKNGTSFADHPLTAEIVKYNEVDCRVLYEILYYLRANHINPQGDDGEDGDDGDSIDLGSEEIEDSYDEVFPKKRRKLEVLEDSLEIFD